MIDDINEKNIAEATPTLEETMSNFATKVGKILPIIVAIAIAIWWVLNGIIKFEKAELGIVEQVGLVFCTCSLAVIYSGLIANGGFDSAKRTTKFKKHSREWTAAIKDGVKDKKSIELYARDIAKENQRELRTANLEANGLYYWDYFDEKGEFIKLNYHQDKKSKTNINGLTKKQIRIIKKCVNIRIVIPTLFGNLSSKFFGLKKEKTQKSYERSNNLLNFIFRILMSVLTVGLIVKFIGFNIEGIIYAFLQIVLWTSSGVSQRMSNYNFVMNKLLPQMVEKTLIINGFLSLDEQKKQEYRERAVLEQFQKKPVKQIETEGEEQYE